MALKIVDSRMFLLCLRPKINYVYNSVQSCTTVEVQKYRVLQIYLQSSEIFFNKVNLKIQALK